MVARGEAPYSMSGAISSAAPAPITSRGRRVAWTRSTMYPLIASATWTASTTRRASRILVGRDDLADAQVGRAGPHPVEDESLLVG
jgi:hypothetical protein